MDIIIVGAGIAGLMAARKLSAEGFKVSLVEARDRMGGRIYTVANESLKTTVEGGAEFIHGNLEVTLDLLKEAGIEKLEIGGEMWQVANGKWGHEDGFFANAGVVIQQLKSLTEDISIAEFMGHFFPGDKNESLKKSLTSYIEGYYSGQIEKISAKAFLEEFLSEDEQQFRPAGGYGKMINYLGESCAKAGVQIKLSTIVKEVRWRQGNVEIIDDKLNKLSASKALVTVPVGVWTADPAAEGAIHYSPALPLKVEAAKQMGFGAVIKVLLEFDEIFWESDLIKDRTKIDPAQFHMALTDLPIPTWWTQLPEHRALLTGWLSGPKAEKMKAEKDEEIINSSLYSLSKIFGIDISFLKERLKWSKVFNWITDPFTLGSYSYSTLNTKKARKALLESLQDTLFFAGEALYEGPEMGTVEAALTSGLKAAEQILLA